LPVNLTHDENVLHCIECGAASKFKRVNHNPGCIHLVGFKGLTQRERQIATLISQGQHMKEIATNLGIATQTVVAHKWNIYRKLNIHSVAMLTRTVVEHETANAAAEVSDKIGQLKTQ
jgi:two-component system response regulator NreC